MKKKKNKYKKQKEWKKKSHLFITNDNDRIDIIRHSVRLNHFYVSFVFESYEIVWHVKIKKFEKNKEK